MSIEIWRVTDCAEHMGINARQFADLMREGEAPIPEPMGKIGAAYCWDPLQFRAGAKKLRAWLADAPGRTEAKRQATLQLKREALARKEAAFDKQCREHEERMAFFRQCERDNADEQDGRATRRGSTAILPSPGSR